MLVPAQRGGHAVASQVQGDSTFRLMPFLLPRCQLCSLTVLSPSSGNYGDDIGSPGTPVGCWVSPLNVVLGRHALRLSPFSLGHRASWTSIPGRCCSVWAAESLSLLLVGFCPRLLPLTLALGLISAPWVHGVHLVFLNPDPHPCLHFVTCVRPCHAGFQGPGLSPPPLTEVLTFLVLLPHTAEGKEQGPLGKVSMCAKTCLCPGWSPTHPVPASARLHADPLLPASLHRGPEDLPQC